MDFLNRATTQLTEIYRSMTPGSRLTAGLLAAVVVLSVGYLSTHQASTPEVDLMHGVPIAASQLPAMEAAFAKANLKSYEIRGTSIRVPRDEAGAYMAALAAGNAVPPNFGAALREALSKDSPFASNKQRDQLIKIAIQDELSLWIRSMDGIETAYVLYDVDTKPGFARDKVITATASVKPVGTGQLDEARVSAIRHLVAGAIAGLKPEKVTVCDLNGRTWYGDPQGSEAAEDNQCIALKRSYEHDLKAKILNALCFIPNVTVEPTVVLDRERPVRAKPANRGISPSPRREPAESAPQPTADNAAGGNLATSLQANVAIGLRAVLGENRRDVDDPAQDSPRGSAAEQSVGLTPKLAKVSVGIPVSYFKKVWQERSAGVEGKTPPTPDPAVLEQIRIEETAKIQKHVAQLLPAEGVADPTELVTVTTFQDFSAKEAKETPAASGWELVALPFAKQYGGTLGMIGLALVSLLVLRSMLRPAATAHENTAVADMSFTSSNAPVERSPVRNRPHVRPSASAQRDEISETVQQNPAAAANVLRAWLGNAG